MVHVIDDIGKPDDAEVLARRLLASKIGREALLKVMKESEEFAEELRQTYIVIKKEYVQPYGGPVYVVPPSVPLNPGFTHPTWTVWN